MCNIVLDDDSRFNCILNMNEGFIVWTTILQPNMINKNPN